MAMTATQKQDAYKFFIVSFGAITGVEYMNQINDAYNAGLTTKEIVNIYSTKPQFEAIYPRFLSNEQFADKLIENVVGASATAEAKTQAKADVVAAINAGWSKGDVVFQIFTNLSNKAADDADWGKTAAMLNNKVKVAEYYTETLLVNDLDLGALGSPLQSVTDDAASVEAAKGNGSLNNGKTFTLTAGIDNFVGTAGDDTFIGGNGAGTTTGPADQLDGGAGTDVFKFYGGNVTGAVPTIKNIENLYFNATNGTAGAAGQINASIIAGVESVEIENAADILGVGGHVVTLGATQSLKLTNINGAVANVGTAVVGSVAGGITLNNVVDKTATPNVAQNLDVRTNNASLTLHAVTAASNINLLNTVVANQGALNTIVVDGDAALRINAANTYTNLTKVDASANTAGVNFVQGVDTNLTFIGGKGTDRVDVSVAGNAVNAQDKLDGGDGKDTLAISGNTLTANAVANIQNFEVLEVRGATVQDASVFDAKNVWEGLTVVNTGGVQSMTVTNLAATAKDGIVVNAGITANTTTLVTTVKSFLNGGTSDSATVTVNANAASTVAARSVTNLTFDNVDNLTLVSKGTLGTNGNTINVGATDLEKLVVTGNIATTITANVGGVVSSGITEVDASGLVVASATATGLTFTQAAGATQSLLVTGTNGTDAITVTSVKGTVIANGGNDTIIFSTAAAALGDQSVNLSAKDFVAGGALNVTYTGGVGGFEVINFSSDIENLLKIGGVNLGTTTANQAVGAAINGQNNVAWDNAGKVLQFDVNGDGVFNAADDFAITLTGTATAVTAVTYDATNDFFILA